MTTGLLYDPSFLDHDTGPGHPERSTRLVAAHRHLEKQPWYLELAQFAPKPADLRWVRKVHDEDYIERATEACRTGAPFLDVPDVSISRRSCEVALLAAGGALELADRLMAGEIDNGFALLRPPGHHAEQKLALGFCLFNNVAILARYLQQHHGLEKVLILDWDVHHGNGTQHTFEEDPSVFYVSLHQYPYYPGTGAHSETGIGRGEGATLNYPMASGSGDTEYESAFSQRILPAIDAFKPEIVLVSAGFDAHRDDPLGQILLSTGMFAWMSERVLEAADRHAGGRLISLLEGGYDLHALAECVSTHLAVLLGKEAPAATPDLEPGGL